MTARSKQEAGAVLGLYLQCIRMNPNGFRKHSTKNGPVRQMTSIDQLQVQAMGMEFMPKGTRSERKARRADIRRGVYLPAVRNNPRYPTGDKRLRQGNFVNV